MGDLQCPVTILLIARESIASGGGPAMPGARHLAGVFVASAVAADPGGLAAAASLVNEGAGRLSTIPDVVDGASLARALEHLADLYRGETVAVVATRGMIQDALGGDSVPADPITVTIDGSGWLVSPGAGHG